MGGPTKEKCPHLRPFSFQLKSPLVVGFHHFLVLASARPSEAQMCGIMEHTSVASRESRGWVVRSKQGVVGAETEQTPSAWECSRGVSHDSRLGGFLGFSFVVLFPYAFFVQFSCIFLPLDHLRRKRDTWRIQLFITPTPFKKVESKKQLTKHLEIRLKNYKRPAAPIFFTTIGPGWCSNEKSRANLDSQRTIKNLCLSHFGASFGVPGATVGTL